MNEKKLWDFYLDYGRMGQLEGVFEATEEEIKNAIGKDVSWDELLGKHSCDTFTLEESMITPHKADKPMGFDPLECLDEEEDDEDFEEDNE